MKWANNCKDKNVNKKGHEQTAIVCRRNISSVSNITSVVECKDSGRQANIENDFNTEKNVIAEINMLKPAQGRKASKVISKETGELECCIQTY